MTGTFRTVAGRGRAGVEVRGSTFVGHAAPAADVDAAEAFVESVREANPDATHVVPAYRVRAEPLREHCRDAGEPGGSAGKPALNVLQGEALENVVVAVVRHYGGTNLGVGGLARAYGRAVKRALADANTVEREPRERFTVRVAYDDAGTVRAVLESTGVDFDADYAASVTFAVVAPTSAAADLRDRLRSATSGRATIERDAP